MPKLTSASPHVQIAWDAHSLGAFQNCPRKYQLSILEGWTTKHEVVEMLFGIGFHMGIELEQKLRSEVPDQPARIRSVLRQVLVRCEALDPLDGYHSRYALVRMLVWYWEHFQNDILKPYIMGNGAPAIELRFAIPLDGTMNPDGEPYLLAGYLDLVAKWGDKFYVVDHKTTKTSLTQDFFTRFSPDLQMTVYTIAGKVLFDSHIDEVLINAAQTAITFSRFLRGFAHRFPTRIEESLREIVWWINLAERCAEEGFYPKNERSCYLCKFKSVCSKDTSVEHLELEANFTKRTWDPMEDR